MGLCAICEISDSIPYPRCGEQAIQKQVAANATSMRTIFQFGVVETETPMVSKKLKRIFSQPQFVTDNFCNKTIIRTIVNVMNRIDASKPDPLEK